MQKHFIYFSQKDNQIFQKNLVYNDNKYSKFIELVQVVAAEGKVFIQYGGRHFFYQISRKKWNSNADSNDNPLILGLVHFSS